MVFSDRSNVDSVFVAGRAVKRHGQLVGAYLAKTFRKLDESRNHILGEGALLPEWAAALGGGDLRPTSLVRRPRERRQRMETGNVVVVGGTQGLGCAARAGLRRRGS